MTTTTRIRPCGESALLLECADLAAAVGWAEKIGRAQLGAVDVVAAARTVLVTAREASDLPRLRRALEALLTQPPHARPPHARNPLPSDHIRYPDGSSESAGRVADSGWLGGAGGVGGSVGPAVVTLEVRYDGPDLADVAELAGISVEALVRRHTAITWKAAFGGFAPGFVYLVDARELDARTANPGAGTGGNTGAVAVGHSGAGADTGGSTGAGAEGREDPPPLPTVPRLGSPRPKVPAGSVALADRFCAVYPGASPGGWRLLGTTEARLWDVDRPQPALITPGTLVRFRDLGSGSGSGQGGPGEVGGQGGGVREPGAGP